MEELWIPPGFTFTPDDPTVIDYLKKKVDGVSNPHADLILEENIYAIPPWDLRKDVKYPLRGDCAIFYYALAERKGGKSQRLQRTVGDAGHWHMTGKRMDIVHGGSVIGYKTALKFHLTGSGKGVPSDWLMTEFRLNYEPNECQVRTTLINN
ncbi:hypothetical protein J5N97_000572 [Dioscorea zingiberensis]|uniref:NAC domain-containing protein n=1 Tax=Dioscorea zingiberensis TaxID=325984 RepID=A0A9D5BSD3_9LILI|nr:hypothetical protein J5N97_000572 [Dioscorea zingiberensis]